MNALDQDLASFAECSPTSINQIHATRRFRHEGEHVERWDEIRTEALAMIAHEPCLSKTMHRNIVDHANLEAALAHRLAHKLTCADVSATELNEIFEDTLARAPSIGSAAWADLATVIERDPACGNVLTPLLHFSGFLALQSHRIAHGLWCDDRKHMALHLQSRCSQAFGVDIHPAARIGKNILIDHAISVVIGETAVVEDDVSMLHEVTLGGRGAISGDDRHPKVRRGVILGAGAKVLGNVELGAYCRVGASTVVLENVPPFCTVVGVPARIVRQRSQDPVELNHAPATSHSPVAGQSPRRGKADIRW